MSNVNVSENDAAGYASTNAADAAKRRARKYDEEHDGRRWRRWRRWRGYAEYGRTTKYVIPPLMRLYSNPLDTLRNDEPDGWHGRCWRNREHVFEDDGRYGQSINCKYPDSSPEIHPYLSVHEVGQGLQCIKR